MKMGWPPTAPKARAGLLTPPGITRQARSYACWLRARVGGMDGPLPSASRRVHPGGPGDGGSAARRKLLGDLLAQGLRLGDVLLQLGVAAVERHDVGAQHQGVN